MRILCGTILAAALAAQGAQVATEATEPTVSRKTYETQVCVVGGGMAGICASVAAARNGAKSRENPKWGGRPNGAGATFALHRRRKAAAKMPLEDWRACMDYGDTTPVKPGERVKHRFFETRFTLPPEAKGRRVSVSATTPIRGLMLNGHVLNAPDLVREIDVTGLLRDDGANLLRWVDGTIHGITDAMLDKPTDRPLGEMTLLFR